MQGRARSETGVIQSVAGAPLAGSMPPAPAERPPAVRRAGRRSPVAESEKHHKNRLFSESRQRMAAILPHGLRQSRSKSSSGQFSKTA
ncbi:hypothetical protein [Xenorhabdus beddingii]|uniref:hypothetical protein n=1 Tax=Xenorhabdus beddingii TaxID=40578 RepID=UPI001428CF51|nr:hypothetical protein [Xenorhabdus beddingii]